METSAPEARRCLQHLDLDLERAELPSEVAERLVQVAGLVLPDPHLAGGRTHPDRAVRLDPAVRLRGRRLGDVRRRRDGGGRFGHGDPTAPAPTPTTPTLLMMTFNAGGPSAAPPLTPPLAIDRTVARPAAVIVPKTVYDGPS